MKYLVILISLLVSISLNGQDHLVIKEGKKYHYNGSTYKCKELGEVYIDHLESYDLYTSGRSNMKKANIFAYVGLGFLSLGGVSLAVSGGDLGAVIIGGLSIVLGGLVEIIGLVPRALGDKKLKKARDTFNFEMIERHGYKAEPDLSFGVTRNGVGLVYSF